MFHTNTMCTVFDGDHHVGQGPLWQVAPLAKAAMDRGNHLPRPPAVLVFDDASSEVIDLDWRGTAEQFQARLVLQYPAAQPLPSAPESADDVAPGTRGPGRPRLGVVAREVTLLPRHWDWLAGQSGGASVALRKLVEGAKRASEASDLQRKAQAVAYKFMSTIASRHPEFEEASRALFAGNTLALEQHMAHWPVDVRQHIMALLQTTRESV
jgi:uncharacterized protein